jgi:oligopeptide/dipeptide ABC transporter ATP-binding protein
MCDRVAVMYAGKIVETAPTWRLFEAPVHPYTEALLRSVPEVNVPMQQLYAIEGQPPSIYDLPSGCAFAPRCPYVQERCRREYPPESVVADGHTVRCWRHV